MPEKVDAVVVGGGIAGASTAYFLAREGVRNVLVLERDATASGASGRASGLVSFLAGGHPAGAALLKASSDFYASWEEEIGGPPALNRVGGMALEPESQRQGLLRQVGVMREAGHEVRILERSDLEDMLPGWDLEGIDLAAYSPNSGYIDPPMVTTAVMNRARALGARVYQGAEVFGIDIEGGRVARVRSTRGDVMAPIVILAGGAWTAKLGQMVGVELPVWGVRHMVMHFRPPADLHWPFPGTGDPSNSVYFRPEAGGLVLAANSGPDDYPNEPPGDPERFDSGAAEWYGQWIMRHLSRRVPAMARAELVGGHAGVYPKGPDNFPLLGAIKGIEGLYCICDTSGGGMTSSPGMARALAETLVHGRTFTDISEFRPSRFAEGAAVGVAYRLEHVGRAVWES